MRGRMLLGITGLVSAVTATVSLRQHDAQADNFAFRMIVPGLAVDSGVPAVGSVRAAHVSVRSDGGTVVTGDVSNETVSTISAVWLRVTIIVDGVSTTRETMALVDLLAPLDTSPFRVIFPIQGVITGQPLVEVLGFESQSTIAPSGSFAFVGPYPFQIGPPDPKTGAIPYSKVLEQLRGSLTNTSAATLTDIELITAVYDGSGNVAWVGVGADLEVPFPVAGQPQQLPSGQSGTFIVGVPIGLLNSIEGHATIVGFVNATLN